MKNPFRTLRLDELSLTLTRDELLRRARILVVDDERPDLIDDLQRAGFAVDFVHDITKDNMDLVDRPIYDLVILDFGQVGSAFGADQGLSLLRHIKRVNPSIVALAYTSKALGIEHADFFRIADGVLAKDAGIAESQERIEDALRKAQSIANLWSGVLTVAGVRQGSADDLSLQDSLMRGLRKPDKLKRFRMQLEGALGTEASKKVGWILVDKLVELGIRATMGAS